VTSNNLSGRTLLITGASSGLGAHFARQAAAAGARLVLAARRVDMLEALRDEIRLGGGEAMAVAMDVADEASTRAAYDAAERNFGLVDSIIANAGMNSEGPLLDLPAEEIMRVLTVNVAGVALTLREGARRLIAVPKAERKGGRMVAISSITAAHVSPGIAIYGASKAAVTQLGRILAREWLNKGINVNIVCPGYIETDINRAWFKTEGGARQIQGWPRKRLMEPSSLDGTVLHLLSDAAEYVAGAVFTIDDGQTL
jgi:NAD(P)-dependent dehydrogenase (short-subunit alcohol dehydrogenase family)